MKAFILICLIIISSCKEQAERNRTDQIETEIIAENSSEIEYTILEYNPSPNGRFKNAKPTNLTKSEIEKIEPILEKAIAENNERQKEYVKNHNEKNPKYQMTENGFELDLNKTYYRQYFPVLNEKGEKEIWINFICSLKDNWKTDLIIVMDGGNCYFNIKINLTNKTYSELSINGQA